jgi:hypothetical protein
MVFLWFFPLLLGIVHAALSEVKLRRVGTSITLSHFFNCHWTYGQLEKGPWRNPLTIGKIVGKPYFPLFFQWVKIIVMETNGETSGKL